MPDDGNLVAVSESNNKERRREIISGHVSSILWRGILLGIVACTCMFGLAQQIVNNVRITDSMLDFLNKYWIMVDWWYWLIPLVLCVPLYRWTHKASRKWLEKNG